MASNNQNRNKRRTPARQTPRRQQSSRKPSGFQDLLDKYRQRRASEFRPDATTATWSKTLRMTHQQQLRLARWSLYVLTVVLCLVIQDVIMSQVSIFGATTDLAVCAILLITVIEGTEIGSIFVLIASTLYYFSGSAPGAYCIALMTFFGIGATLFRQMFWHRSKGSVIFCAGIALTAYEIGLFVLGLMSELTLLRRLPSFGFTALFSCLALIPLYSLIYKIGMIGGNIWKE